MAPVSPDFVVERVRSLEGLLALGKDWTRLFEQAGLGLPFATHEWAVEWWSHFAQDRRGLRDSLDIHVVRERGGEAVAIAPFMATERPARGPFRLRTLEFVGADPNITELRTMMVKPGREATATTALVRSLLARAREWDWLQWNGLRAQDPQVAAIEALATVHWWRETPSYVLHLGDGWPEFRKGPKRNIKESLRRCYNSLAREGLAFRLEVAESGEDVAAAMGDFFELHRRRALTMDSVAHPDCFASPTAQKFLKATAGRLAARRATRVYSLRVADRVVAVRIAFLLGGCLYLYYSGYDPAWRNYSVMTTLVAETFKHAMARGIRMANLSTGRDVSKTRWGPEEIVYHQAALVSPRARSRLLFRAFVRARRGRLPPGCGAP